MRDLDDGELAGAVDGHVEIELALGSLHLGDVDVEIADGVAPEGSLCCLVALDLRQATDVMALEAPVQRRASEMGDCRLQGVKAIVERQERVLAKGDGGGLFFGRQYR